MLIFRWIKPVARVLVIACAMRKRDMARPENYATRKLEILSDLCKTLVYSFKSFTIHEDMQ